MGIMRNFLLSAGFVTLPLAAEEERSPLSERGAREREGERRSEDGRPDVDLFRPPWFSPRFGEACGEDGRGVLGPAGRGAGRPVDGF
jgi:hypothetical protein